jgi:hypothetical protein
MREHDVDDLCAVVRHRARAQVRVQQLKLIKAIKKNVFFDFVNAGDEAPACILVSGVEKKSGPPVLTQIRLLRKIVRSSGVPARTPVIKCW